MRAIFPREEQIWSCLQTEKAEMQAFSKVLFETLGERLEVYLQRVTGVEEVSRCCESPATVVTMCIRGNLNTESNPSLANHASAYGD